MLGVLLDAAAIIAIVFVVNQGEQLDFAPAAIAGVGISLGCLVIVLVLGELLGIFMLVPMVAVAIAGIWMGAGIPLGRAAVGGVIFLVYKIAVGYAFEAMMSTSS